MVRWEILKGLPPYGPSPLPFPQNGYQAFRKGMVVRFHESGGATWVGNFQPGISDFDRVVGCSSNDHVIVVSGGWALWIDVDRRREVCSIGQDVDYIQYIEALDLIVLGDGTRFCGYSANGKAWDGGRSVWDNVRDIAVDRMGLTGEAWNYVSQHWVRFKLNLLTGAAFDRLMRHVGRRAVIASGAKQPRGSAGSVSKMERRLLGCFAFGSQ